MERIRGGWFGTSSGPGEDARNEQNNRGTHLSPLSVRNAGQTGLNRITQAVFSTSTWYAFAEQVIQRRTLPYFGGVFGGRPHRKYSGCLHWNADQAHCLLCYSRHPAADD